MNRNKTYFISLSLSDIRLFLTDLTRYGRVHPLILETQLNAPFKAHPTYTIKEKPYPKIPLTTTYQATVIEQADGKIRYDLEGIPLLKPTIIYTLKQVSATETNVNFDLQIKGMPLAKRILMNKMMKAQDELMEALEQS